MISDSLYFKLTYLVPNAFPSVIIIFSVHFNEYDKSNSCLRNYQILAPGNLWKQHMKFNNYPEWVVIKYLVYYQWVFNLV